MTGHAPPQTTPRPFYGDDGLLGAAGFEAIEYRGTYEGAPLGVGDRIVVAATRGAR